MEPVDRHDSAAWQARADQVWKALGKLAGIAREQGGVDGVGLGWDFERGVHALQAHGDPVSLERLPAEVDGFRVRTRARLS